MARRASQFFFLSILLVCSSGLTPLRNYNHKEIKRKEDQKAIKHDLINPPLSTQITNPVTTPSNSIPNVNPSPTIVNVPSTTNPIIISPNPASTPVTIPSATPVSIPNNFPMNSPLPVTNPVTTPSTFPGPVTNPATNPFPTGGVPIGNPGTVPVVPPGITNGPGISGQSWCVAKSGSLESALQAALDYSCGNGADCSAIQQGGSCYIPTTLENHASYAFNSYYQKNPVPTSCDFGGTAMITNSNPSTGSCIYPASSPSALPSPVTTYPTPITTPTPTTESSTGAAIPGAGPPPFVLNTNYPPAAGGTITGFPDTPPGYNSSTSKSSGLQPSVSFIILVTSIITGKHIFDI